MGNSDKGQDRFRSLMAEYEVIDKVKDPVRAADILLEAGFLLDRQLEPKKWAACRSMYAQHIENTDPLAAISAYRETLSVWDPVKDRDSWVACHSGIGSLMVNMQPFGPLEHDEAILHLELAVNDQPFLASLLAVLYRFRTTGDPWENWKKRIYYLQQHLLQISKEQDPNNWAQTNNELGVTVEEEPDADYAIALEERILHHQASLVALDRMLNDTWIETCVFLSECFLFRVGFEHKENLARAEQYARQAIEACKAEQSGPIRAKALLALAKALMAPGSTLQPEALHEGLELCRQAAVLLDSVAFPALMASVESIRANTLLKLMLMGETEHKETLALHAETALKLLQGPEHFFDRRSILQVAGDGMLAAGDYESAASYLKRALDAAATAVLSGRFYYEWIEKKCKPSRALREAQNWIRQVTVNELMELLRGLKSEPPPVGPLAARIRTALRTLDAAACPFAEPYFWAAFTISGKE
ncbi:MAG: CHAT domain-containing protein [Pseudomonadota bacterium]